MTQQYLIVLPNKAQINMYQRRLAGCYLAEDDVWLALKTHELFLEEVDFP